MASNAYTPPGSPVADRYGSVRGAVTPGILDQLRRTRPWVLVVAIVFLIAALFMVLAGVAMMAGTSVMMASSPELEAMGGQGLVTGMGIFYIFMAVLFYLIPSILLFRYAGAIKKATNAADAGEVEAALSRQAGFWKYVGIFTLIMVVLMILAIGASILLPAMMMGGMQGMGTAPY